MFSSVLVSLFVSLILCLQQYAKTTQSIFTKFGGKVELRPRREKEVDFGGRP